ncbi:class I SAM-dependent methyltransferase [Chrysiogenes arsenatis]|uniref:class I SAM-dependent methyltransferase n=1 Tax=Chrysiogenes arsenatis TaxID=309797 RepID=UPI00040FB625|nr:class I SAM-dependent methyltransferase [Chrysiogenes arsenatis]
MLLASKWKDYQLLDCGFGMKYERWGQYTLVRPDPQVIWPGKHSGEWSEFDACYHRSNAGGGQWEYRRKLPEQWTICYGDLTFKIKPTGFKHTGLFPEQAVNWDWIQQKVQHAPRAPHVLNLFGYTGGATVAAAKAGAQVCHVDAAKGMVQWCRENAELSDIPHDRIRYIVDDCLKFVQREAKRGKRYDAVIMDPPSYGRGKEGETWKLEKHLWELLQAVNEILAEQPLFFLINSYTTGLSPTVTENLLREILEGRGGTFSSGEIGIPIQHDGKVLPCGIYGRWEQ